jgi:hypothetical protein
MRLVFTIAVAVVVSAAGVVRGEDKPAREHPVPAWVFDGFLSVQAMEGNGVRRGYWTLESSRNIAERRDPAIADRLKRQGIGFVILHGLMGAGLKHEHDDGIAGNKALAAALKAKGIRRVLYVQTIGTIFYESFFAETPAAVGWVQRLPSGSTPTYYTQWFRYIPCLNNDDYIAYVKDELRTAMDELDLDGVFTDNYGYYSYSCTCEHCLKKFRAYLAKRYPDQAARLGRFNLTSFDYVKPPPFDVISYGARHTLIPDEYQIVDPISQEWIRFRCERLGEVTRELAGVVKAKKPDALWFVNYPYGGTPGLNNAAFHGGWPENVYPGADLISAEVAGPPHVTRGGVAQGRALLMKVAKNFGVPISTFSGYGPLSGWTRLQLAEGMAFNAAPMDLCGDIRRDDPPAWMRSYLDFYRDYRERLGHATTVADCAVLHNFESLSYLGTYPQESLQLCEQSLIQAGIPFDIVFDRDLARLDQYRCLFLANAVAMRRETAERIAEYVRRGGSVVVTDDTSALNEHMLPWKGGWLEPKKTHLLADFLGVQWPQSELLRKEVGKGRVAAIPAVNRPWVAGAARGRADQERASLARSTVSHSYGPAMPATLAVESLSPSHDAILNAVDYALDGARTIRVNAGAGSVVIPEVTQNAKGVLVHLVNWNEQKPVEDVHVSLRVPSGRTISELKLLSPDPETPAAKLAFERKGDRVEFTVPKVVCYVVIAAQP